MIYDILLITCKVLFALSVIHLTVLSITLYLHRGQTHSAVQWSEFWENFFKLWLWFACGMDVQSQKEWVAVHRKHHAKTDTDDDPHNPAEKGAWKLFLFAFFYYRKSVNEIYKKKMPKSEETEFEHYSKGLKQNSSFDRFLNTTKFGGLAVSCLTYCLFLGWFGFWVWVAQTLWMPVVAGGVINVLGHTVGHADFDSGDSSKSLAPKTPGFLGCNWLLVVILSWADGGEHLHNPHHFQSASARFGLGTGLNFDIGFWWLMKLSKIGGVQKLKVVEV